jgi:hypothetical protein
VRILQAEKRDQHGPRNSKSRIYFFDNRCSTSPTGGTTVQEAFVNRRTQPYRPFRKLIPELAKQFPELAYEHVTFSWSQYAGCTCPCSPGFIVNVQYGQDYYVEVGE